MGNRARTAHLVGALGLAAATVGPFSPAAVTPASAAVIGPVDTVSDNPADGYTLREAIDDANGNGTADVITFAPGLTGTIHLGIGGGGTYLVSESVEIVGPGPDLLTIDGDGATRMFTVGLAGVDLSISGVTLQSGLSGSFGGAIRMVPGGDLVLDDVVVDGNDSATDGGGIFVGATTGDIRLTDVDFDGNTALNGSGGGLFGTGIGGSVVLERVTLQANSAQDGDGGGIWIEDIAGQVSIADLEAGLNSADLRGGAFVFELVGGDVSATGLVLDGNDATVAAGGGVVDVAGRIDIVDATITDNVASGPGGGLLLDAAGPISVRTSSFARNRAETPFDGGGGAFVQSGDAVEVREVSLDDNVGGVGGGMLIIGAADVTIEDVQGRANGSLAGGALAVSAGVGHLSVLTSTFSENLAEFAGGGALRADVASLSIADSTFVDNDAADGGAVSAFAGGIAAVRRSLFARNGATGGGGALYIETANGTLTVGNSTFSQNTAADDGGALVVENTTLRLEHSTLLGNTSTLGDATVGDVGAVAVQYDHTLSADNTGASSADLTSAVVSSREHSLFADLGGIVVPPGTNLDGVDPQLGPLGDHGGPTLSHLPPPDSAAVDAGDPAIVGAPADDQRGESRIVGAAIDIGAVERQANEPSDPPGPPDGPGPGPGPSGPGGSAVWVPVGPARLVDTRPGSETVDGSFAGDGVRPAGGSYEVAVAGRAGIPADARAVIVNATAVQPVDGGFLTMDACLGGVPTTASLNFTAGVNLGNEVLVDLDGDGSLCVFTEVATHVTLDVVAYVPADSPLETIAPARYADSRPGFDTFDGESAGFGRTSPGTTAEVAVAGRGPVPGDAAAVLTNVVAVAPADVGFVTAHECLPEPPLAASLNHVPGVNRGNDLVVATDDDGDLCLFTSEGVHLTVDVVGHLPPGSGYEPVAPARLLETRPGESTVDGDAAGGGRRDAGSTLELAVAGRAGLPSAEQLDTVVVNVTAIQADEVGFVTVYGCDLAEAPLAASLNYVPGVNGGNQIVVEPSPDGEICLFTSASTHLTVDIAGWTA